MVRYSIKDLERISGIKAHTIRIWEQRYRIIHPQRTETNIRYYSDDDLKRILNISILNNHGVKISRIAELNAQQIHEEVKKIVDHKESYSSQIEALVMAMMEMDEDRFEEIVTVDIASFGFLSTIEHIIYPFFEKVGILWQTGSVYPAQEHFMSNLIRQKIIVAIDSIKTEATSPQKKFLLFLPEGELHEIGLLVYAYIIKQAGHKVYYLGQTVPYEDILHIRTSHQPDVILSIFTNPYAEGKLQSFLNTLSEDFAGKRIGVSGYQFTQESIRFPSNISRIHSLDDLKSLL